MGNITYLALQGGEWAYMAGWLDLFSRKVSGWSVEENMEEERVHRALHKVIGYNQLGKGSIIHSDRAGPSLRGAVRWQRVPKNTSATPL